MTNEHIYKDIAKRTNGDIYIGVVGPVRSGKSTFIKKFMEFAVLPNITDTYDRQRTLDELPQAASGKTVMTTEPKFVPDDGVGIVIDGNINLRVKMIDCVGYIVPDALGQLENGSPRMVNTPWSKDPLPFAEAAEIGTRKVICEHSTIGMLITTDGSIGELPRESYVEAEERVARELAEQSKPFAIILNSARPQNQEAIELAYELERKYNAPVALINCTELDKNDIDNILKLILNEFPVTELKFKIPEWSQRLPSDHWLRRDLLSEIRELATRIAKMGDIEPAVSVLPQSEYINRFELDSIFSGSGTAELRTVFEEGLYYKVISELCGINIASDEELIVVLSELAEAKRAYDKVADAIADVNEKGYGIVMPDVEELHLKEPKIIKQAGSYGVKLSASAQSIHMIRANIETEINPIVGTEQQSEELVKYMLREFEEDPVKIWESNMFGKSLYELVNEGIHTKLEHMPDESRKKLSETLERIINEGSGGLICIIL